MVCNHCDRDCVPHRIDNMTPFKKGLSLFVWYLIEAATPGVGLSNAIETVGRADDTSDKQIVGCVSIGFNAGLCVWILRHFIQRICSENSEKPVHDALHGRRTTLMFFGFICACLSAAAFGMTKHDGMKPTPLATGDIVLAWVRTIGLHGGYYVFPYVLQTEEPARADDPNKAKLLTVTERP
eukprot:m.117095 g.117095  ORF g.117095 m.117095 type:complete len:182 (-) comp21672_c0_seq11:523-1068(-)